MNDTLSELIEVHSRWLSRHVDGVDADEWLHHYDALTCLWRKYRERIEEGKAADAAWEAQYRASDHAVTWREAERDLAADQTAAAREGME